MENVGAYEAKSHLSQLLDRVEAGEQVMITRHGRVVAVLRPPEPQRVADTPSVIEAVRKFRKGRKLAGESLRSWIDEGRR